VESRVKGGETQVYESIPEIKVIPLLGNIFTQAL
jgi:hypothetical protein